MTRAERTSRSDGMNSAALCVLLAAGGADVLAQSGEGRAWTRVDPSAVHFVHDSFGGRSAGGLVDLYSNVDRGPHSSQFFAAGIHGAMEPVFLQREDPGTGDQAGVPARVSQVELWLVNSNSSSSSMTTDVTVTVEFYAEIVDWAPAPEPVNRVRVGGFYVDRLHDCQGCGGGIVVDLGPNAVSLPHGRCCVEVRCWEYNNGAPPIIPSTSWYPAFNGVEPGFEGRYPLAGDSRNSFYQDVNGDGVYQRKEKVNFGSDSNYAANLMIALRGHDGCALDLNGDSIIDGRDIDELFALIDRGCP